MVKYSIIIPVYNCEEYLEECVSSLQQQEGNQSFEIILIDDGSEDQSGCIAEQLADKYEQVRAFHKENGGASSARNRGILEAKGKYILFIDGDDTVDGDLLETVDRLLERDEKALIIYGMSFDYYRNGHLERCERLSCAHSGSFSVNNVAASYQSFFFDNALSSACNKVFQTEIIRAHNLQFTEGMTLYEDYDFVLRYLVYVQSVICVNRAMYHYRNDLVNKHLNRRVQDLKKLRQNLRQLLKSSMALNGAMQEGAEYSQVLDVSVNLYMQLLIHNLMVEKYTAEELKRELTDYCNEPIFRSMITSGARLSEEGQKLLKQIDAEHFRIINWELKKRKMISKVKRAVKKLLGEK